MGDSSTVERLIRQGIAAFKAGHKDEARALFMRAVELDQKCEQGWLWLSAVVDSLEEQRICLENVLAINPDNHRARKGLQIIAGKLARDNKTARMKYAGEPDTPSAEEAEVPHPQQIQRPTPAFTDFSLEDFGPSDDETWDDIFVQTEPDTDEYHVPTSVDWGPAPDEPTYPGSGEHVDLPSPEEFDEWVAGLNLGTESESKPVFTEPLPQPVPPSEEEFSTRRAPIGAFDFEPQSPQGPFVGGGEEIFTQPPEDVFHEPAPAQDTMERELSTTGGAQAPVEGTSAMESEPQVEETQQPLSDEELQELFDQIPSEISLPRKTGRGAKPSRHSSPGGMIGTWLAALTLNAERAYKAESLHGSLSRTLLSLVIAHSIAIIIVGLGIIICNGGLVRLLDPYGIAGLDVISILIALVTAMPISIGGFFLAVLLIRTVATRLGSKASYLGQVYVLGAAFSPIVALGSIVLAILMMLTVLTAGNATYLPETPLFLPAMLTAALTATYSLIMLSRAISYVNRFDFVSSVGVAMLGIAALAAPMVLIGCALSLLLLPPAF